MPADRVLRLLDRSRRARARELVCEPPVQAGARLLGLPREALVPLLRPRVAAQRVAAARAARGRQASAGARAQGPPGHYL